MPGECCPGCGQPITPAQWARCVAVTRDGQRCHLACLERGLPVPIHTNRMDRPWFLLAARTASPAWLRPGARFQEVFGDSVIIAVPMRELLAQLTLLATVRLLQFPAGITVAAGAFYAHIDDARLAAAEAAGLLSPAPSDSARATVAGIWGPDDPDYGPF